MRGAALTAAAASTALAAAAAGAALAVAGLLPGAAASAAARAGAPPPRAAILLLPWTERAGRDRELLTRLDERGLAVGLVSPTVGGYRPEQLALDMSQGARVPLGLYPEPPPALELRPGRQGGATVEGWDRVRARASAAPARLEPGLLAEAARRAGRRVVYLGDPERSAVAIAADRSGRVARAGASRGAPPDARAAAAWRAADLLVGWLPPDETGLRALDRVLAARAPADLVLVVRAPPRVPVRSRAGRIAPTAVRPPLLAAALAGPPFGTRTSFSSATTRRPGLVAATDVAPTVLERLGVPVPEAMRGRSIEPRPRPQGASAAMRLRERLAGIVPGRPPALLALFGAWVAAVGALAAARGRKGARAGLRLGLLGALWFPGLALLTGGLAERTAPPAALEPLVLALASVAMALLTDRLLPWPRGPALPAIVVLCAYLADLAAGSPLTSLALVGPNPAGGARFFGVGNELEALLSVSILLGVGAAASSASLRPGRIVAAFAAGGLAGVAILGSGRLGADVGAAITLGAGSAVAAACALPSGRRRRAAAVFVLLAPALALGALAVLDQLTGADAHLSRSVLDAGPAGFADALERRLATQRDLLVSPLGAALSAASLAVLAVSGLAVARASAGARPAGRGAGPLLAAAAGALAAILAGAAANDSAPDMLAIGAALSVLLVAYVRGGPAALPAPAPQEGSGGRATASRRPHPA